MAQAQRAGLPPPEGVPHPFRWGQRTEHLATGDSSQALNPDGISFQFLPFEMGTSSLCLSHQCILEAGNWFSRLTACKQLQQAVKDSLGRDGWRTETLEDVRQAVLGGLRTGEGRGGDRSLTCGH